MAKRNLPTMEAGEAEVNVTPNEVTETTEPVKEETNKNHTLGKVAGCAKLNVRQKPNLNAKVVCIIDKDTVVTVDKKASNKEWFKVTLDVGEGFCMKKFIQIDS